MSIKRTVSQVGRPRGLVARRLSGWLAFSLALSIASTVNFARAEIDPSGTDRDEYEGETYQGRERPTRVEMASIGLDLGLPLGSAESKRHSATTLGIGGELMFGSRYWTAGGFLRLGVGGLTDVGKKGDNGLFRSGPRLRLGTPLHPSYPSLFLTAASGFGIAYAREIRERTDPIEDDVRVVSSVAYWQLFLAPGVGILVPFGAGARSWQPWFLALGANYYFTHWLQEEARRLDLATGWFEATLSIGSYWLPK